MKTVRILLCNNSGDTIFSVPKPVEELPEFKPNLVLVETKR